MPPPYKPVLTTPYGAAPPASRFTLDAQVGQYGVNEMRTLYTHWSGNLAVPVAGPDGAACEVVKQHAAFGGKLVQFVVSRYGLMPLVPGVERGDPNCVYLDGAVEPNTPAVAVDGYNYTYLVRGWYRYVFLKPVWVDLATGLPLGGSTTDRSDPSLNVLPAAAFVDPTAKKGIYRPPGDQPNVIRQLQAPAPAASPSPGLAVQR